MKEEILMNSLSTSPLKNESIQEVSKCYLKMIGDPTRLSILFLLQKEELSIWSYCAFFRYGTISNFSPVKNFKDFKISKIKKSW